jgi:glycosyltransferase involved in cell wall biosynthesis
MDEDISSSYYSGRRNYSVLLSAYACEPGLGSEAAVGWDWATNLAQAGCEVHVITRTSNRDRIERENINVNYPNLRFTFFDLPRWLRAWKRGNRGVHLYYLIWQMGAYLVARRLVRMAHFDLVHHVTYVTARFPSFMGFLGLPFIFGPLAGGEYAPSPLWRRLGKGAVIKESLRYASMLWWRFAPLLNLCFASAQRIFVTSRETLHHLPRHAQSKAEVMLGIGLDSMEEPVIRTESRQGTFEILYAGRFLYLKGMDYGLEAVGQLLKEGHGNIRLTMIGDGPSESRWHEQSRALGLDEHIVWCAAMPREEFIQKLPSYDVLLFPSLHDSGGMVVLEAMAAGIPVVCLDYGGPAVLVDNSCGFKVHASTPVEAVEGLRAALRSLVVDRSLGVKLGKAGRQRAAEVFSWKSRVDRMLLCYKEMLCDQV